MSMELDQLALRDRRADRADQLRQRRLVQRDCARQARDVLRRFHRRPDRARRGRWRLHLHATLLWAI